MKLLATVLLGAGLAYLIAKKTGILESPEADRLAGAAKDIARHASESAMSARQAAMDAAADKVEDLAGDTAARIRG